MTPKSEFLHTLTERGFIHQCTDLEGLDALMAREKIPAYIGFDCTAKSLHVGNLMSIMVLRWLQKTGHHPIVLVGGGTTKIGDPSGKDEARKLLSDDDIIQNLHSIHLTFERFLAVDNTPHPMTIVNNDDWLKNLNYIQFLRDYGRHFSINRMLSMDSVKLRLEREQELSFLEFNYMILQAYDFIQLNKEHGCRLQIGGSDQWGNIVNGVELNRRLHGMHHTGLVNALKGKSGEDLAALKKEHAIFGLTTPLITTSSGAKMGKTAAGAVWLNADMLSPFDYWQFWRNTEDADVGRFLRFFTELPIAEIQKLEALKDKEINEAKKILATEATALCHGRDAAQKAAETARQTFEQGHAGAGLPEFTFDASTLGTVTVRELLLKAELAESGGEAKKLVAGGGVKINDHAIDDASITINACHLTDGALKLSKGKKHHAIIKFK